MDLGGRLPYELASDNAVREALGGPRQALLQAATAGDAGAVERELADGANADGADVDGRTSLHLAAEGGHLPCVRVLVETGNAVVDPYNAKGETPLFNAVAEGHTEVVRYLLEHGADASTQRINLSAEKYSEAMGWISSSAAGGEAPPPEDNPFDSAPLHVAAAEGDEELVDLLLTHGAVVDARDGDSKTPLHIAIEENELGIMRKLLDMGADACAGHRDAVTALHWCSARGKVAAMRLLLEAGADKASGPMIGETLIEDGGADPWEAPGEPDHVVAARLSARFRNRRWIGPTGWTPLLLACRQGKPEAVQLLLQYAVANPFDVTPETGTTSRAGQAKTRGQSGGRTVLHILAGNGRMACLQPLLGAVKALAHAHPDHAETMSRALLAPDGNGRTPLDVAVEAGRPDDGESLVAQVTAACDVAATAS